VWEQGVSLCSIILLCHLKVSLKDARARVALNLAMSDLIPLYVLE